MVSWFLTCATTLVFDAITHASILPCMHPSIQPPILPSIHLFVHPYLHPSINPYMHPSSHASMHSSAHLSIDLFVYRLVIISIHPFQPSVHSSLTRPIYPSIHASAHPLIDPTIHSSIQSMHPPMHPSIYPTDNWFITFVGDSESIPVPFIHRRIHPSILLFYLSYAILSIHQFT